VIFVNTKEEPFNTPAIPNPPLYAEADLAGIDADADQGVRPRPDRHAR
jgi:hypothetical protein